MNRLNKILKARELLRECGEYDTSVAGAVGEVYAEEMLGMKKAERGAAGYDGWINDRKVQVKTKEFYRKDPSSRYVAISRKNEGKADDLVVVVLDDGELGSVRHLGPIPIGKIKCSASQIQSRYYYRDILAACAAANESERADRRS